MSAGLKVAKLDLISTHAAQSIDILDRNETTLLTVARFYFSESTIMET